MSFLRKYYHQRTTHLTFLCLVLVMGCAKKDIERPFGVDELGAVWVADFGAVANDGVDDTHAFQSAIDAAFKKGGGTVLVPNGRYIIDAVKTVMLKDSITLRMDSEAYLVVSPNDKGIYNVLQIRNVENVKIIGGNIQGERYLHRGIEGEWGMGIGIYEGRNITVEDVVVKDCWGDGIYVGKSRNASQNITIKNVKSINNRRQGMSVTAVDGMVVTDSEFSHTGGTAPQAGIDIEPNEGDKVRNVTIKNCVFNSNEKYGLLISSTINNVSVSDVIIENNQFTDNRDWAGCLIGSKTTIQISKVEFKNNTFKGNTRNNGKNSGNEIKIFWICDQCVTSPNTIID